MKVRITENNYLQVPVGAVVEVEKALTADGLHYFKVIGQQLLDGGAGAIDADYSYFLSTDDCVEVFKE